MICPICGYEATCYPDMTAHLGLWMEGGHGLVLVGDGSYFKCVCGKRFGKRDIHFRVYEHVLASPEEHAVHSWLARTEGYPGKR